MDVVAFEAVLRAWIAPQLAEPEDLEADCVIVEKLLGEAAEA